MKLTEKYTDISYIEFHDDRPLIHSIRHILDNSITGVRVSKVHGRIVLSKERIPDIKSNYEKELIKILKQKNGNLQKACKVLKEVVD